MFFGSDNGNPLGWCNGLFYARIWAFENVRGGSLSDRLCSLGAALGNATLPRLLGALHVTTFAYLSL